LSKCQSRNAEDLLVEKCRSGPIAKKLRTMYKVNRNLKQDYETPFLPAGQLLKMVIHSSWGDPYYVGLNSIELIDVEGKVIGVDAIGACPSGLNSIGVMNDARVVENLVNNNNSSEESENIGWLAPLVASLPKSEENDVAPGHAGENVLFMGLDAPTHIAAIRINNYDRTPNRGVRDFSLWLDGVILYRGYMNRQRSKSEDKGHVVLFSGIEEVLQKVGVKGGISYCGEDIQDVLCIDEKIVREKSKFMNEPPDPCAEGVKADLSKRPKTGRIL